MVAGRRLIGHACVPIAPVGLRLYGMLPGAAIGTLRACLALLNARSLSTKLRSV